MTEVTGAMVDRAQEYADSMYDALPEDVDPVALMLALATMLNATQAVATQAVARGKDDVKDV